MLLFREHGLCLAGMPGLAVVCVPLDEALVHEAPGGVFCVDLHEHVGVGVIASGGHDVVLRAVVVSVVDPLVDMAGDDQLDSVLIFLQQRMQAVVGEFGGLVEDERVVDEDEGGLVLLELGFEPVKLLFAERAGARVEVRRGVVLGAAEEVVQVDEFVTFVVHD